MFIAHGGSGTAFKADVKGGYADSLQEKFAGMKAGDRDTLVFMQNAEPLSLYCADETDGETLRACHQICESLYGYGGDTGLEPVPALATGCTANADLTVWTCALRPGVKFQDGAAFAADDVITSFAAQWDDLNAAARRPDRRVRLLGLADRPGQAQSARALRAAELEPLPHPASRRDHVRQKGAPAWPAPLPRICHLMNPVRPDLTHDPLHRPTRARQHPGRLRDRVPRVRAGTRPARQPLHRDPR